MAIGTLKLPLDYLDELSPQELGLLMENYYEKEEEKYELMSYAFKIAYISAKKGKHMPLFEKNKKQAKVGKITQEQKQQEIAELDNIFGSGS